MRAGLSQCKSCILNQVSTAIYIVFKGTCATKSRTNIGCITQEKIQSLAIADSIQCITQLLWITSLISSFLFFKIVPLHANRHCP